MPTNKFPFKLGTDSTNGYDNGNRPLDGTYLPILTKDGASYSRQSVDSSSTGRDQTGTMIREQITIKDKWELEFIPCTQEQFGRLMAILDRQYFYFTYPNPSCTNPSSANSRIVTKKCYCGDRSAPVVSILPEDDNGDYVQKWGNLKFSIIEV